MSDAVCLFEILVPTQMDGKPIRTRFHRAWDNKVRLISKGLTVLIPVKGQWVSPSGDLFVERMIPVRIACTRLEMEQIAKLTAEYYKQESIMFYRISDEVYFRRYD